jgi:hypothetical protein
MPGGNIRVMHEVMCELGIANQLARGSYLRGVVLESTPLGFGHHLARRQHLLGVETASHIGSAIASPTAHTSGTARACDG